MAYLRNAAEMRQAFAKLCAEPWFTAITDQVVAKFAGRRIPEGGYESVAQMIIWIGQQAAGAGQKDHPLMNETMVLVKLTQALTADTWLQTDVVNYIGGALRETGGKIA